MSAYTASYALRYSIPSIQQQIEVAMITAAQNISNEDPATADHTNRIAWAKWANQNSSAAWIPFAWPVAMNPSIQASVEADPSGQGVKDSDIQFVVNSNVEAVITYWVAKPPSGA
jgi:hypothetical protein